MKAIKGVRSFQLGFFMTMFIMTAIYVWWMKNYYSIQLYPPSDLGALGRDPAYFKVATLFPSHMEWIEKRCTLLKHDDTITCSDTLESFCDRVMEKPIRLRMVKYDTNDSEYQVDAWVYHGYNTIFLPYSSLNRLTHDNKLMMTLLHEQFHIVLPEIVKDIAYNGEVTFPNLSTEDHCMNADSLVIIFRGDMY
jgi:hypothetical protein